MGSIHDVRDNVAIFWRDVAAKWKKRPVKGLYWFCLPGLAQ
jgi:hypothetical protein